MLNWIQDKLGDVEPVEEFVPFLKRNRLQYCRAYSNSYISISFGGKRYNFEMKVLKAMKEASKRK
jgi:hypothetical protein